MSAVSKLLSEKPISYHPALAKLFGSVAAAIFFEHIAHWQGESNKDRWVFRTQEEIEERTALSPKAQQGARRILRDSGVLEEKHDGLPRRLYYRPVWEKVELLLQSCQKDTLDQTNGNSRPDQRGGLHKGSIKGSIKSTSLQEDADASPEEKKTNWFTIFCERSKEAGLPISDEDRSRVPGNLVRCAMQEKATEQEMYRLIGHMISRRISGVVLSPQEALKDIRGIPRGSPRARTRRAASSIAVIGATEADYDIEEYRFHE